LPVLLVPGWKDRGRVLHRLRTRLIAAGWPPGSVAIVDFADRFGSNAVHADEIATAECALRASTGAAALDIVAHSMGGLAVRRFLARHDGHGVRRAVFVATPHRGTWAALLAWGGGRSEMMPGSAFLAQLGEKAPPGVETVTIRTLLDLRILPGSSARLDGAIDRIVPVCTHRGLIRGRTGFAAIHGALTSRQPPRVAHVTHTP
jgi:pimeloyl-ACP methyl ester carboxylesterase